FSQIEREKSQWTDEIIKIAEKKNQSEALLEREKAKQAAAEKAALEKAAREAQEAAEKAAEIQEAQTAWQECLMKRKVVAEKYRLAITAAEQYFSAGTKQAVPPDYVVDAILMANIKWKSARDASMAIYRRNMNSRNNDQDHRFCATNPEYRSAEMAANVVSATESSLREFVEKRYEADTAPISGSRANTIYAAAHNAVAQAYPPVYQAERAAGKNLVPHGAASLAATKASVAVVAPLIRAYAYDDASSTIVAAIAGAESFLAAVQKSSTADIQAGVSFGQYWTNALNACVREKNAWKNIANAGSSWNQAQLMAAQNATKEADQVFQVLKEARDAAYAVIDRPSSQQQQKALEKSQSAKLKAKVDQKRAEKFSAFQVPEAKEEEFYRIKVVRITTQIEEAKQASKEGWGGENSYLWDRIARKLEQSRESSNKAHKLVIQGKTEKSILWEKEAEASEASADGMRQVVQAYISGNKKAAEQLEKEKWNTFMASDISTWSLKSDEALEKANQEQGQNKNFWESLSMQYKAAVDYRRKALESYNLGKEDSCNLASIALSLHSSADYQAKVSEAENTGKTTLVAGYREAAAIYQEAANQYKKAIKVSTLERIRGERQSGEGTRLRQSGDAMQAEANAIAMKAEEANNAMQEADKSKNDWAQKVNEVKQEEIARKEA
ncbi:MAG TPA: hypothetical protein VJK54_05715, partial [Chthoniobacterales bacterium]|nr:hypothetical protein [Chthoniobacterales bacterium]